MKLLQGVALVASFNLGSASEGEVGGLPGCRCIGDPLTTLPKQACSVPWASSGQCVATDSDYGDQDFRHYSELYGGSCRMHADVAFSDCYDASTDPPTFKMDTHASWCPKPWCYVDPCSCNLPDVTISKAFNAQLGKLSYSYATCGSVDSISESVGDAVCSTGGGGAGGSDDPDACVPLTEETFTMDLVYPAHNKTITVPPVPTDVNMYAYATDNAMVAIPAKCYEIFKDRLGGVASNFHDRQPGGPTGMYYMRVSSPADEFALLEAMGTNGCAAGLVVMMHGTSGFRWNPASYSAMLSGMGYVVVGPDSHAQPATMGLKGAEKLKTTAEIDTSNYCGSVEVYEGKCGTFSKPMCYSTKDLNILNDRLKYKQYVQRAYLVRKLELDYFVQSRQALLNAYSKVVLFGRSEGAMVASRYYHADLHPKLSALIISGWSCEFNYFLTCAADAHICENKCSKDLPILNVNGDLDAYFGALDSVSSRVSANKTHGYGADPITGSCRSAMNMQGFKFGTAVQMPPAGHSILYSHDNALRSTFADFLAHPATPSEWHSIQRPGCTYENGVYDCDALLGDSGEVPCVSYKENPSAEWHQVGSDSQYPMTCGDVKKTYKGNQCCGNPLKHFPM